jgi:regulator of sirC expression with transglutaminase-like and TPR domain
LILQFEPENTRYLAERALLRKEMGLAKEALVDFKRYFSFTDKSMAPITVQQAHDELTTI